VLALVVASLPSPSSGALHIGSLQLRMYGLMIALGVIAAVWLTGRRMEDKGIGTRDQMAAIALWAVPAGIIGARLYHVITDWQRFEHDPVRALYIWEGGLGIWGGIALGVAVGAWRAKKLGIPLAPALDAVAPALPLAQAIGRLGNWWNQELFGRPTDLPWGLEISPEHRPTGYEGFETFHPTFLYEALWSLLLVVVLIWIDRKGWLRPGRLILVYVAGYTFARFFIEGLRIDDANEIAGLRVNEWVSVVVFAIAVGWLVIDAVLHRHDPKVAAVEPVAAPPSEAEVPPGEVVDGEPVTELPPERAGSGDAGP
jgi:prolipoprotein diacylglyceryl transferase